MQVWKPLELMLLFPGVTRLAVVMKTQFTLSHEGENALKMEEKTKGESTEPRGGVG